MDPGWRLVVLPRDRSEGWSSDHLAGIRDKVVAEGMLLRAEAGGPLVLICGLPCLLSCGPTARRAGRSLAGLASVGAGGVRRSPWPSGEDGPERRCNPPILVSRRRGSGAGSVSGRHGSGPGARAVRRSRTLGGWSRCPISGRRRRGCCGVRTSRAGPWAGAGSGGNESLLAANGFRAQAADEAARRGAGASARVCPGYIRGPRGNGEGDAPQNNFRQSTFFYFCCFFPFKVLPKDFRKLRNFDNDRAVGVDLDRSSSLLTEESPRLLLLGVIALLLIDTPMTRLLPREEVGV